MSKKIFSGIPDGRKHYVVGGKTKKTAYENMKAAKAINGSYYSFCKYMSEGSLKHFTQCEPYDDVVFLIHNWCTINERYEKVWPNE